jgi:hypothetical protein
MVGEVFRVKIERATLFLVFAALSCLLTWDLSKYSRTHEIPHALNVILILSAHISRIRWKGSAQDDSASLESTCSGTLRALELSMQWNCA